MCVCVCVCVGGKGLAVCFNSLRKVMCVCVCVCVLEERAWEEIQELSRKLLN